MLQVMPALAKLQGHLEFTTHLAERVTAAPATSTRTA